MRSSFEVAAADGRSPFIADPLPAAPEPFRSDAVPAPPSEPDGAVDAPPQSPPPPDLEELTTRAREEGRVAGRAELPWQEAEQLVTASASLEEAARDLAALRDGYLRSNRRALIEMALAIAGRLVEREVAADPDALVAIVERALSLVPPDPPLVLRLSARDARTVGEGRAPQLARLVEQHGVVLEPADDLAPGGVQLAAQATGVDARLPHLLHQIRDDLLPLVDMASGAAARSEPQANEVQKTENPTPETPPPASGAAARSEPQASEVKRKPKARKVKDT